MKLAYTLDNGASAKAAFGVVVLQSDETLESEFAPLFDGDDFALLHTRIPFTDAVNPETLGKMKQDLPEAVTLFPSDSALDVIAYGCTSGTTMIGIDAVEIAINSVQPSAKITNPVSAVIAACRKLGIGRIGMLTPYLPEVSAAMQLLLETHDLQVVSLGSFEQESDRAVARIAPASILDGIETVAASGEIDAVFVSCTNLRTFPIIEEAEAAIGKPVITSNQALAWHMFTLAGCKPATVGPGRLFAV